MTDVTTRYVTVAATLAVVGPREYAEVEYPYGCSCGEQYRAVEYAVACRKCRTYSLCGPSYDLPINQRRIYNYATIIYYPLLQNLNVPCLLINLYPTTLHTISHEVGTCSSFVIDIGSLN